MLRCMTERSQKCRAGNATCRKRLMHGDMNEPLLPSSFELFQQIHAYESFNGPTVSILCLAQYSGLSPLRLLSLSHSNLKSLCETLRAQLLAFVSCVSNKGYMQRPENFV
jgi:hypothetical protein